MAKEQNKEQKKRKELAHIVNTVVVLGYLKESGCVDRNEKVKFDVQYFG